MFNGKNTAPLYLLRRATRIHHGATSHRQEIIVAQRGCNSGIATVDDTRGGDLTREDRPSVRIGNSDRDRHMIVDAPKIRGIESLAQQVRSNHRSESHGIGTPQDDGV